MSYPTPLHQGTLCTLFSPSLIHDGEIRPVLELFTVQYLGSSFLRPVVDLVRSRHVSVLSAVETGC
jgi:hypothetical protein